MTKIELANVLQENAIMWVRNAFFDSYKFWKEEDQSTRFVIDEFERFDKMIDVLRALLDNLEGLKEEAGPWDPMINFRNGLDKEE